MNTTELKKLAEAATPWCANTYREFHEAANPAAILKLLAINAELAEALKSYDGNRAIDQWDESYPGSKQWDGKRRAALTKAEGGEL